jgi:fatty-acyl-CoA synthase
MTGNCSEFLESVVAASRFGTMAVPANFRLSGPEAAFILQDAGAALLVDLQRIMRQSHLAGVVSATVTEASATPIVQLGGYL